MGETNILIVDDEDAIRLSLSILLKREGYNVDEASSGNQAMEKLAKERFDLVISDIMMPGMDGVELLKQVKESDSHTDVIMITAYASLERAIDSLKFGASDFIQKPYENRVILDAVKKVVEEQDLQAKYSAPPSSESTSAPGAGEATKLPIDMSPAQLESFKAIFTDGMDQLAESLGNIIGDVTVEVQDIKMDELGGFPSYLGDDGLPLAGSYTGVYGDLAGGFLMLFEKEDCRSLVESVLNVELGIGSFPSDESEAVVTELGDILAGFYVSGLRSAIDMTMKTTDASFVNFLSGTILNFFEVRFGKARQYSIFSPARITVAQGDKTMVGYLISVFSLRSLRILSEKLE
jgi:CheY-like chemotaxis protein/chemotaxis protein CheY-P-specific phosphatase CheC